MELKKLPRKSSNKGNREPELSLPYEFFIAGVSESSEAIAALKRPQTAGARSQDFLPNRVP